MIDVPILRGGRPYRSKEAIDLCDYATGEAVARLEPGQSGPDLARLAAGRMDAAAGSARGRDLGMLRVAARSFMTGSLPIGGRGSVARPSSLWRSRPRRACRNALCRQNMAKIESAMLNMATILDGLTGGLDLDVLDRGYGQRDGHTVSYAPKARRFGAVLPANSPGVHALWLPAFALKMPLALKPGQREPWTPLRIIESLRACRIPGRRFWVLPVGARRGRGHPPQVRRGDDVRLGPQSVRAWAGNPRIEIHGPGFSKVMLGPDKADAWQDYLDVIYTSVSSNGGRSCINASSVRTPAHGRELADALAQRLAEIRPRGRADAAALLAAFPDPATARGIDAAIERGLAQGGGGRRVGPISAEPSD